MRTFFTSDTHFNHANIIQLSKRPFKDLVEMNEALTRNWNEVVRPEDVIFHLGDFAMGQRVLHKGFLERLNGYKVLIQGNHDGTGKKMLEMGWNEVNLNRTMSWGGKTFYMAHVPPREVDVYPDRFYHKEFTQSAPAHDYWLCGHVHEKFKRRRNVINVGVDIWDYKPVTLAQLMTAEAEAEPFVNPPFVPNPEYK